MYQRLLSLPPKPQRSFFLWGPRQAGKSSLLKKIYPNAPVINLLKNSEFARYSSRPELLHEEAKKLDSKFIIIDEIQKVPQLLDEVHYLIEEKKMVFGLCGSSARKLKKQHANLLGGRAQRFELSGLVSKEIGKDFDLNRMLNSGYLPVFYDAEIPHEYTSTYCVDYLKEEIMSEGLIRRLPPFSRFLELAALSDTELLSFETFARDVGVKAPTIRSYFEILSDTLIGHFLPAYIHRPKRRIHSGPKFYFSDVGVVNHLAQRENIKPGSELYGKAFENWVHHELRCYLLYKRRSESLSFWRLSTQVEVDFIIGQMKIAIEAKATKKVHSDHLKGLRELIKDHPEVKKRVVISLEDKSRVTDDGVEVLSAKDFVNELWSDNLLLN